MSDSPFTTNANHEIQPYTFARIINKKRYQLTVESENVMSAARRAAKLLFSELETIDPLILKHPDNGDFRVGPQGLKMKLKGIFR